MEAITVLAMKFALGFQVSNDIKSLGNISMESSSFQDSIIIRYVYFTALRQYKIQLKGLKETAEIISDLNINDNEAKTLNKMYEDKELRMIAVMYTWGLAGWRYSSYANFVDMGAIAKQTSKALIEPLRKVFQLSMYQDIPELKLYNEMLFGLFPDIPKLLSLWNKFKNNFRIIHPIYPDPKDINEVYCIGDKCSLHPSSFVRDAAINAARKFRTKNEIITVEKRRGHIIVPESNNPVIFFKDNMYFNIAPGAKSLGYVQYNLNASMINMKAMIDSIKNNDDIPIEYIDYINDYALVKSHMNMSPIRKFSDTVIEYA